MKLELTQTTFQILRFENCDFQIQDQNRNRWLQNFVLPWSY